MRANFQRAAAFLLVILAAGVYAVPARGQRVVDRVVARIENGVILQSDVDELAHYQRLVDGTSESDAQVLDRLIDQWIVRTEAQTARYPQPSEADVTRSLERLQKTFASPEEYEARKKESGLTDAEIRRIVQSQLYLSGYLDSRFRPTVQLAPDAIEQFYNNVVVPRAKEHGRTPPALDKARDYIQEALTLRSINDQADQWLKESRARLQIEKFEGGAK
jgi:hypothetical protein